MLQEDPVVSFSLDSADVWRIKCSNSSQPSSKAPGTQSGASWPAKDGTKLRKRKGALRWVRRTTRVSRKEQLAHWILDALRIL